MIFETLITSAQRGIRPGRTGFQPVMQSSALREDILRQLEPFAAYRHVHQQGSGKNPECCSFRRLRTNIGELFVLIRTVDAGNDYSNRSNKCSHILAITADEVGRFFNSTPANILTDNPSLFLSNWMGGPESRAVPPQLMSLPHRPSPCAQWQSCFGDAALAGVVAQRIRERKPTLFVAQDSTPQSSQMLLKLFAEASALLNQAERWDTTFETTILGKSQSLLQGTYKQSAESEIQQTGLLRLEVGQQQRVPAELMNSPLCVLAREGEKQQSTPSRASATGTQHATRQSPQGDTQPTPPPKPPPGPGKTASPSTSAKPVMPNTRDAGSAKSQDRGTAGPPVPLHKEQRSWGMWAAVVFAFPVAVIFFIVLVVLLREPVMDLITDLKNKIDKNEAVVAEEDVPAPEEDMPAPPEIPEEKPPEVVTGGGSGAIDGMESKTPEESETKLSPSKSEIWDEVVNNVGNSVSTETGSTGKPKLIEITDKIEHLKDIQGELVFKFAKVQVPGGTFNQILTSQKSGKGENIEWPVMQKETPIGKFVIDDDQICFRVDAKQGSILHFLIPMTIEWPNKGKSTDFFCLKDLLPNTQVDQLSLTLQLDSGTPTYLKNLLEVGKPLKIPRTDSSNAHVFRWLQNVKASVRLEMQALQESVTSEPDDPKFGISINSNELRISVKNGEQNLVEPIELSLAPKLVKAGVEVHLKEYSGWLEAYYPQNKGFQRVNMRGKNRTELSWETCKNLTKRVVNASQRKALLPPNFIPDFLWTDLYNAGDIDREFRRKEASFNVLCLYQRYAGEQPRDWEDVTAGGNSQQKFETGFKKEFGESEWADFSKTTGGGQRSRFSSYAPNRPKNIIKEELPNLEKVKRLVSKNPDEDSWTKLLRTKLVKAYWFCRDKEKYNTAYPDSKKILEEWKEKIVPLEKKIEKLKKESGVGEALAKAEKELAEAKETIAGQADQQRLFKNDTEDTKKLRDYWEFCKEQVDAETINKKSNQASGTQKKLPKAKKWEDLVKSYNKHSGFWAGLLLEELPKAYVCQIAEIPLYNVEGLMESTDLSKKLTGEIFCTVQMGKEQSEIKIGNIESAPQ